MRDVFRCQNAINADKEEVKKVTFDCVSDTFNATFKDFISSLKSP